MPIKIDAACWGGQDNDAAYKLAEILNRSEDDTLNSAVNKHISAFNRLSKSLQYLPESSKAYYAKLLFDSFSETVRRRAYSKDIEICLLSTLRHIYRKRIGLKGEDAKSINHKLKKKFSSINENSEHFRQRLKERYNIEISAEQYMLLCNSKFHLWYKLCESSAVGEIEINGCKVLVIRNNGIKDVKPPSLITAYPNGDSMQLEKMPVPIRMKKRGITKNAFWEEVKQTITKATELSKRYDNNNKKDFFIEKYTKSEGEQKVYDLAFFIAVDRLRIGDVVAATARMFDYVWDLTKNENTASGID